MRQSSARRMSPIVYLHNHSLIGQEPADCSLTTPSVNRSFDCVEKRILIADDHSENRYILRRVLESSGYQCFEASTGVKALEIAQTLPDLIILDVGLPDLSGIE